MFLFTHLQCTDILVSLLPFHHRFLVLTCSSIQTIDTLGARSYGRETIPLPSCAYTATEEKFKSDDEDFVSLKNMLFWSFNLVLFQTAFYTLKSQWRNVHCKEN